MFSLPWLRFSLPWLRFFYRDWCFPYPDWGFSTLTEVFPCFFLSCKANARVKLAKTGHGTHSSQIVVLFYVLFVLCRSVYCFCVYMCTVLLPPGVNPIAVNKHLFFFYIYRFILFYTSTKRRFENKNSDWHEKYVGRYFVTLHQAYLFVNKGNCSVRRYISLLLY